MAKKLTQKTCLLLTAMSLAVCLLAYGCIWVFLPYVDRKRAKKELESQAGQLVSELRGMERQDSGRVFLDFIRETGADLYLLDEHGQPVSLYGLPDGRGQDGCVSKKARAGDSQGMQYPFQFAGAEDEYLLCVCYNPSRSREISAAVLRSLPVVAAASVLLSFAGAWFFSRYTTRPIIRIRQIAERMANLDFSWYCPDVREDEIGMLSKSINELSDQLHAALKELHRRNHSLEDEIQMEKERERRRMLFFSGISHELKTPVAIVIGQLEGMQAGIGVYKDREKYLARSREILQSLDQLLKEILLVSRIGLPGQENRAGLSQLVDTLLQEYEDYAEFSSVALYGEVEPGLYVYGEEQLLKKAVGNIIGNAIAHSPENAAVRVELASGSGGIRLSVSNAPAHIEEEHLPHLFEAFYRADASPGHGSGLGLYITRLVLETFQIPYEIKNTADGVRFNALFSEI